MARMDRSARSFLGVSGAVLDFVDVSGGNGESVSLSFADRFFFLFVGVDFVGVFVIPPARDRARYFFLRRFVEDAVDRRENRTMSCFGCVCDAR